MPFEATPMLFPPPVESLFHVNKHHENNALQFNINLKISLRTPVES